MTNLLGYNSFLRTCNCVFILLLFSFALALTDDKAKPLPTCLPEQFHYEYTECDSDGGRWRVQVPEPNTCSSAPPEAPVRGKGCEFTCPEGQYLDMSGDQTCKKCAPGTYSMGGGVRFNDWDKLPAGFSIKTDTVSLSSFMGGESDKNYNCSKFEWSPEGKFISSHFESDSSCSTTLTYTVTLVKPGKIRFEYQYSDENSLFHFIISNNECQSGGERSPYEYPRMTDEEDWEEIEMDLKTGMNVLKWRSMNMATRSTTSMRKPIRIRDIKVSGIAYTSECTKCNNGTHAKEEGAAHCDPCPTNTYSNKGATECTACDNKSEYAEIGSAECKKREPCKDIDYYEYYSDCDDQGMTQKMFKWIEPRICNEELEGSVTLPSSGEAEKCPPCNPGMELKDNACEFCPENMYSNGSASCAQCPASTAPHYGITYEWWGNLPLNSNISANCLSMSDRGCASKSGWIPARDHIHSGTGHSDDVYLVLSLEVAGFRGRQQVVNGKAAVLSEIVFVFELECQDKCQFFFVMQTESGGNNIIESWEGAQSKQRYSYQITKNEPMLFTWVFQKTDLDYTEQVNGETYLLKNDLAKIYSINLTNTLSGGASECKSCPKGTENNDCIPCPAGHYTDPSTLKCKTCPEGTVVQGINPWGQDSCVSCGNGLVAKDHQKCVSTCSYTDDNGKPFSFDRIAGVKTVEGSRLFTGSGTQYYHLFKISLCGDGEDRQMVTCADNITSLENSLTAMVCRSTVIPPKQGEDDSILTAQSVSIGDILVNISRNSTNMEQRMKDEGFVQQATEDSQYDLHFTYFSEEPTAACKQGRTTIITLRCDGSQKGNGTLYLPPKCPDGTCDGCSFHFLWKTAQACPACNKEDFKLVKGECVGGEQEIHYIKPKHCLFTDGGDDDATIKKEKCSVLPFWLQVTIMASLGVGLMLIVLIIYCWKKNQKLEYKYMKLVAGSSSAEGELPAAETCALDEEDEDDEQFDRVDFNKSSGNKFINKLKSIAGKGDNPFEDIKMSDRDPLT